MRVCRANGGGNPGEGHIGKTCTYTCKCRCDDDFFAYFLTKTYVVTSFTMQLGSGFDSGSYICHGQNGVERGKFGRMDVVFESFRVTSSYRGSYPDVYDELAKVISCCKK